MYRLLCWLIALLLLAQAGFADVTLTLKGNRKQITGQIDKLEGDKVFVKTGSVRVGIALAELTPASHRVVADALLRALSAKDANGFLDLGDFCLRHKLWQRARKAYARAPKIDDSYVTRSLADQGLKRADQQEARALYQLGVDHQSAGRTSPARTAFETLIKRFPGSRYAGLARRLLVVLKPSPKAPKPAPRAKPPKKPTPPKKTPRKKTVKIPKNPYLRYMQRLLAEIEQHRKTGLREEGAGHNQKAIKAYEKALSKLDTIKQVGDRLAGSKSPLIAQAATKLAAGLPKLRITFYLALGHIHASVDQLRQATRYVNEVLIVAPEHKEALALRDRITTERMRRVININKLGEGK